MKKRKEIIQKVLDSNPEAHYSKNKYRVLRVMLLTRYPQIKDIGLSKDTIEEMIFDMVNGDRDWRKLTEEHDKENKKILSQQWMLDNGYEPTYKQDQQLFKNI